MELKSIMAKKELKGLSPFNRTAYGIEILGKDTYQEAKFIF